MRRIVNQFRLILFLLSPLIPLSVAAETIIAHSSVQQDQLKRSYALSVFSMKAGRWPDGQKISVFVLPDRHPSHIRFVKNSLHIFPYQLRNIWDRAVFSGTGQPPVTVSDREQMLLMVRSTKGAIGYLDQGWEGANGVKIIYVD